MSCYTTSIYTAAYRSGKDKLLHDVVSLDILPQLVDSAAARRRAEEKQAAIEAMPKKRSSRLQVWLQCHSCVSASVATHQRRGKSEWSRMLAGKSWAMCLT